MGEDSKEQVKTKENKGHPFDDVFHTAMVDCQRLILPMLNEMFHCSYQGNEKIESLDKDAFWHNLTGKNQKRTSDSALRVVDKNGSAREFIIECQTNHDETMVLRILEYGIKFAIDRSNKSVDEICINIPSTGVLQLRDKEKTPDNMRIRIIAPNNEELQNR